MEELKALIQFVCIAAVAAVALVYVIVQVLSRRAFNKSSYGCLTGNGYNKTKHDKGLWGEYTLCRTIESMVESPRLLMNVYVPRDDAMTSECDLVVVGASGIWVFENKNYSGWIFGNGKQKTWTQSLNKATKERFYNPCWQNQGHVRALASYLSLPETAFVSVVVFGEDCELKKITGCPCPVIKIDDVRGTMKRLIAERGRVLSEEQQRDAFARLGPLTHADDDVKAGHMEHVKVSKIR